jgi:hypothetical protein
MLNAPYGIRTRTQFTRLISAVILMDIIVGSRLEILRIIPLIQQALLLVLGGGFPNQTP